ncbi:hypothetical protein GW17_00025872 [Ensete ventricosum]|nr:hypothetical protein GW17_00025872 [Ensete ventricosum]RZS18103.1 hypothetical protein BHM03_00050322 [Ensete ventricosum]
MTTRPHEAADLSIPLHSEREHPAAAIAQQEAFLHLAATQALQFAVPFHPRSPMRKPLHPILGGDGSGSDNERTTGTGRD